MTIIARFSIGTNGPGRRPAVGRLRTNQTIVGKLLEDVRRPAGDAAAREQTRELVARNTEIGEHRRGIEVDVGIDLAIGLLFGKNSLALIFEFARDRIPLAVAHVRRKLLSDRFEMFGARIAHAVLAMAHSHDAAALRELVAHELLGFLGRPDRRRYWCMTSRQHRRADRRSASRSRTSRWRRCRRVSMRSRARKMSKRCTNGRRAARGMYRSRLLRFRWAPCRFAYRGSWRRARDRRAARSDRDRGGCDPMPPESL